MHSSRMRTVHSSGRILGRGTWFPGGWMYLVWGGVPGPGGYTWSQGVYLVLGGVPGPRGCTWVGTPPVDRHMLVKHNLRNFVAVGKNTSVWLELTTY